MFFKVQLLRKPAADYTVSPALSYSAFNLEVLELKTTITRQSDVGNSGFLCCHTEFCSRTMLFKSQTGSASYTPSHSCTKAEALLPHLVQQLFDALLRRNWWVFKTVVQRTRDKAGHQRVKSLSLMPA